MQKAVLGIKKGMTQVFDEDGTIVPVTVIDLSDVYLVEAKESDKGATVQLGVGSKKKPSKAEQGKYSNIKKTPVSIKNFKLNSKDKFGEYKEGDQIKPSIFEVGDFTQVTAITKGKGFAGVVKRWGFAGGRKTHGQSDRHRAPGSIGAGTTPGRVFKGKKMAGRMGGVLKTIMNVKVVGVDEENSLLLVKGTVPGANGGLVEVRESSLKASSKNKETKSE